MADDEHGQSAAARAESWRMKCELYAPCRDVTPNAGHVAPASLEALSAIQTLLEQ